MAVSQEVSDLKAYHINQRDEGIDLHGVSGALMATTNMQMQTFVTGGPVVAFAANQRDEVRDLHDVAAALGAQPGMKQQTFVAGITAKGNGDCFLSPERHTSLSGGGGQAGQGYPCVLTAGFSAGAGSSAGSIGYGEEVAPTLKGTASGNCIPSILCLNDQGGSAMGCSEDVAGTLRAQEHGHQPLVFENHGIDARYTGPHKVAPTMSARYGTGGNNVPLVTQGDDTFCISLNTQKSYREAINLLLLYFKTELGLEYASIGFEDITYSNITGFLEWLSKSRGCSPATVNLRLMAIRSFTKYAGILDSGKIYMQVEVGNISVRKTPGKVVEFLTAPALETLFEQPNRFKTNGYRDFCFMRLMYDTAARCQELVDAKIHDLSIRKTHATICLTGKGNKLRIVPISPSVVELLKTYLDKAHPTEQRQSDDYLFFTTHHGRKSRMSTDAVNLFMKKYGEMARRACPEVPERVHPHQLRHSRAMHLYRAGMPLVLLSEFLGHADVNTTRIYAWADTEMKRQAIQKVSKVTEGDTIEPIWANDEELIKRLYGLA